MIILDSIDRISLQAAFALHHKKTQK